MRTITSRSAGLFAIAAVGAILVSGCGSAAPGPSSTLSPAATTDRPPADNGEAAKPATRVLADAALAMSRLHSFSLAMNARDHGEPAAMTMAFDPSEATDTTIELGSLAAHVIVIGSASYLSGNAAFYKHVGATAPSEVAGRWFQVPPGSTATFTKTMEPFRPTTLRRCIMEDPGTMVTVGVETYRGQRAVKLHLLGDKPGSGPGYLWVAASGPPYLLGLRGTGPSRPGGVVDPTCSGSDDSDESDDSDVAAHFGDFNGVAPIHAPAGALVLGGKTA